MNESALRRAGALLLAAMSASAWCASEIRAQADAPVGAGQVSANAPAATIVTNSTGQKMRLAHGAPSAPMAGDAPSPVPAGAVVVEAHGVKMLRMPGVIDDARAPAAAAAPLPGMRIVDLPPGAVAPVGMPEPRTLYRVTPRPVPQKQE